MAHMQKPTPPPPRDSAGTSVERASTPVDLGCGTDRDSTGLTAETASAFEQALRLEIGALRIGVCALKAALAHAQAQVKQARYLAFHDDLTLLPNRRYFRSRLKQALRLDGTEPPSVAMLYMDLDGFKSINDTHGHAFGDKVLRMVASRLVHAVRAEDIVSRVGGDEYACLIRGTIATVCLTAIAAKVERVIAAPFCIGDLTLCVRPSVGIAVYPTDGLTSDALMDAADAAMYRIKKARFSSSANVKATVSYLRDVPPRSRPI